MISEVGKAVAEVSKDTAKTVKDVSSKTVDVTKRVDISAEIRQNGSLKIDITKRQFLDHPNLSERKIIKDINEIAHGYISDLKSKCEFPDTIPDNILKNVKFEPQSTEKIKDLRENFDDNKFKLRKSWEEMTGKEWPKYKEDVFNSNGIRIRKAGDCYDGHHIIPLELGGKNDASNLTPIDINKHNDLHFAPGCSYKELINFVKGS